METASVWTGLSFSPWGDQAWVLILYLSLMFSSRCCHCFYKRGRRVGGTFCFTVFGEFDRFVVAYAVNLFGSNLLGFELSLKTSHWRACQV